MNDGRNVMRIVLALLVIALAVGIGVALYQAGYAQGFVESGRVTAPAPGTPGLPPYAYAPWGFYRPFGFGFFPFGCLFPLFGFLLVFLLFRLVFWGGRWGMHRRWEGGVPPRFDEWHRRAHGEEQPTQQQPGA